MFCRWVAHAACVAVALACLIAEASAQVIRGRIADAEDDQGIDGAMVTLTDRHGREQGQVLTRDDGYFIVRAQGAGEFRVRVDRIGYATEYSEFVHVAMGDTIMLRLASTPEAISLDGIEASADRQCRLRPEEGLAVARVWEEARKALAATAWTQDRGMYRYETLRISREMDEGRRVESEDRVYEQRYSSAPYVARSADSLVTHGFVQITPTDIVFWAPDAAVLLSDPFLNTHCFRLVSEGESMEGATGIEFEPAEPGRVPDISGTMWLDRQTAHLEKVDFRFVDLNVAPWLLDAEPGGSVEFLELSDGSWIIPAWHLRMFRAGEGGIHPLTGRPYPTLDGVTVHSGHVLRAHAEDGVVFESAPGYRIAGIVRDSLEVGLPDARVFMAGSGAEATTDSVGRFELAHLVPAEYTLHFSHPYLDDLWYPPTPFTVTIEATAAEPVPVVLDAPPLKQVLDRICDSADPPAPMISRATPPRMVPREGILMGHVRDQEGAPLGDARVIVVPEAYEVDDLMDVRTERSLKNLRSWVVEKTSSKGFYRACWVPVGVSVEVMVLRKDEFDQRRLDELLDELQSLRAAFPEQRVQSITIDRQSPHRNLNLEATTVRQEGRQVGHGSWRL